MTNEGRETLLWLLREIRSAGVPAVVGTFGRGYQTALKDIGLLLKRKLETMSNEPDRESVNWRKRAEAAEAALQRWKEAEQALGNSYLRIRAKLDAWDTPHAPTREQVWQHTEDKLDALIRREQAFKATLEHIGRVVRTTLLDNEKEET